MREEEKENRTQSARIRLVTRLSHRVPQHVTLFFLSQGPHTGSVVTQVLNVTVVRWIDCASD